MATKKDPKPAGAGDLGETVTHLKGAADALRNGDWASAFSHLKVVLEQALAAYQGGHVPHAFGAGAGDCAEEAARLETAAAQAEAGAVDWAALLMVLLPILQKLFAKK